MTAPDQAAPSEGLLSSSSETRPSAERTDPKMWVKAFAGMVGKPTPSGFSDLRWRRIIDAATRFLDRWAVAAAACGWSNLDVFGCNPDCPDARIDSMGLVLLLDRCEVVSVDEHGADLVTNTGIRQRFYRHPPPCGTVSLWELAR